MTGNAQAASSTGRVRLYLAASLDGYIASPDGGVEWLEGYGDAEGDAVTFMKSIGGAIMGRATYDFAVSHPWMLGSMPVAVLTHRPIEDPPPGVFAVSGDTKTNSTLWPVLNACDDLKVLVIEVSFPDEQEGLATRAGHYCPSTMCRDLELLRHDPEIWLTGMKPGEESRILDQVLRAAPDKNIQMLSRGTILTV